MVHGYEDLLCYSADSTDGQLIWSLPTGPSYAQLLDPLSPDVKDLRVLPFSSLGPQPQELACGSTPPPHFSCAIGSYLGLVADVNPSRPFPPNSSWEFSSSEVQGSKTSEVLLPTYPFDIFTPNDPFFADLQQAIALHEGKASASLNPCGDCSPLELASFFSQLYLLVTPEVSNSFSFDLEAHSLQGSVEGDFLGVTSSLAG
jgi:hypothetical protein